MGLTRKASLSDDSHPIDIVQGIASRCEWTFDRVTDDQIALAIEGQWHVYSTSLVWSAEEEILRLICTFELDPPEHRIPHLLEALNTVNDKCWAGAFSYWEDQSLMVFRYALLQNGSHIPGTDQIEAIVEMMLRSVEKYYPVFQLVTWGEREVGPSMQVAIAETYGHA